MSDHGQENASTESTVSSPNEPQVGKVVRPVLAVGCGIAFMILGIFFWLLSLSFVEAYLNYEAVDAFSFSVFAVLFVSAGISSLLVASFGVDASVTYRGKILGGAVIQLGSFFAIWALVGASLGVVMTHIHERRAEVERAVAKEREAHMPYRHFMEWLATESKDNMGIRVAASLAIHEGNDSDLTPYTISVSRIENNWMDRNGDDYQRSDGQEGMLFGLVRGAVALNLWEENGTRKLGTMHAELKRDLRMNVGFAINAGTLCSKPLEKQALVLKYLERAKSHIDELELDQAASVVDKAIASASSSSVMVSMIKDERDRLGGEDK